MKQSALATLLVTALSVGTAYAAAVAPPSAQGDAEARNPSAAGGAGVAVGPNAPSAAFTLTVADQTKLKDWIMQQKTASVAAPSGFNVAVGQTVPASITLNAIPASAGVSGVGMNQYAVIDNKIVLVNPTDRKIVLVVT